MKSQQIENIYCDKVYPTINSQGIKANGLIFLVTVGKNVQTGKYEKGMAAQAKRAMENFKTVLEENGSSLDKVIKITVYIADLKQVGEFNDVYYKYFPDVKKRPVRCCVEVAKLAGEALVELELIALDA
jgi:2-iminobutanoate/2-iminopropanoate deaminase